MRAKELFEAYHAPPAEDVAKKILKNCQPFLKQSGGNILFRGTKESNEDFFIGTVDKTRGPRDSTTEFHENMVVAMSRNGLKADRGNSIFCSGDIDRADYYGDAFVIFPIGDFDYSWSREISDLKAIDIYDGQKIREMDVDELTDFVDYTYTNNDLSGAIDTGNEIMISCNNYYAVGDAFFRDEVEPLL